MNRFPPHLLHTALEGADLGVWVLDLQTDHSSLRSLRHDQMFGYATPQAEWGEAIALKHIVEEDRPVFREAFAMARTQGLLTCEVRVQWPDGSVHWIRPWGRTEYDEQGVPIRMSGVVADITRTKTLEAQALHQQKMQCVTTMASRVAHDINNVLQGVTGALALIERRVTKQQTDGLLELIPRAQALVARAACVTHGLRALSYNRPLRPAATDLAQRVRAVLAAHAAPEIQVALDVEPALPAAYVDAAQLEEVLGHVLLNAVEAMGPGGSLHLTLRRPNPADRWPENVPTEAGHEGYVLLQVKDDGQGIGAEHLSHVFDPFYTCKATGAKAGLGLTHLLDYLTQSQGGVCLDSEVGRGTTVTVWLPTVLRPGVAFAAGTVQSAG